MLYSIYPDPESFRKLLPAYPKKLVHNGVVMQVVQGI